MKRRRDMTWVEREERSDRLSWLIIGVLAAMLVLLALPGGCASSLRGATKGALDSIGSAGSDPTHLTLGATGLMAVATTGVGIFTLYRTSLTKGWTLVGAGAATILFVVVASQLSDTPWGLGLLTLVVGGGGFALLGYIRKRRLKCSPNSA